MFEALAISFEGRVVIDATHHVRPVARVRFAVCGLFEIHHVERISGVGDDIGGEQTLECRRAYSAESSDVGTTSQKVEERAAIAYPLSLGL